MSKEISWKEKFRLILKDELSIKDIMKLCSVGQPRATRIRNKALEYAKTHNIRSYSVFVPTDAVLKVLNKDATYFLNKMNLESNLDRLESGGK